MAVKNVKLFFREPLGNYWDCHVENCSTGFEKHITTCPVGEMLKQAPEICTRLLPALAQGLVSGVNPAANFRAYEAIPKGDTTCHYRVSIGHDPKG